MIRYLGRRFAAFVVDVLLWSVLFACGLWLDHLTGWLYPYDGAKVGYAVMVFSWVTIETVFRTSPGKRALGLRLVASGYSIIDALQIFGRGLLFWTLFLAPASVMPLTSLQALFGIRANIAIEVAATVTLSLLPALTLLFGKDGIHDEIFGVRVILAKDEVPVGLRPRLPSLRSVQCGAAVMALVLFISSVFESKYSAGALAVRHIERQSRMFPTNAPSSWISPASMRLGFGDGAGDRFDLGGGWTVDGYSHNLAFPVSLNILKHEGQREQLAVYLLNRLNEVESTSPDWIGLTLFTERQLGFAVVTYYTRFVRRAWPEWFGYELEEKHIKGPSSRFQDSLPVIREGKEVMVYSQPHMHASIGGGLGLIGGTWDFGSLNFVAVRPPPSFFRNASIAEQISREAIQAYNKGLDVETGNLAAWLTALWYDRQSGHKVLALMYYRRSDYHNAVTELQHAVERSPSDGEAWHMLGNSFFYTSRFREAETAFTKGTRVQPQNPLLWIALAGTKLQLHDSVGALKALNVGESVDLNHFADRPSVRQGHKALRKALSERDPAQSPTVKKSD